MFKFFFSNLNKDIPSYSCTGLRYPGLSTFFSNHKNKCKRSAHLQGKDNFATMHLGATQIKARGNIKENEKRETEMK